MLQADNEQRSLSSNSIEIFALIPRNLVEAEVKRREAQMEDKYKLADF